MATYQELLEQKRALEQQAAQLLKQIEEQQTVEKAGAVEKVKSIMAEYGLTIADLQETKRGRKLSTSTSKASGLKVAAKYKDDKGNGWSGRGLKPKWLTAAMAEGKKIEDFAV